MDLDFNEEQRILQRSARDFLREKCPKSLVREMIRDEKGYPEWLWKEMADLGWLGVSIPEEYGGTGGDFLDLAILLEAMGEACLTSPFFSTVVLGAEALLLAGKEEQKKKFLPRVVEGALLLALAAIEPGEWYLATGSNTIASRDLDGYRVRGTKYFVENAHVADYMILLAQTEKKEMTLFLVDGKCPGIRFETVQTLGNERQSTVIFQDTRLPEANTLGRAGEASRLMEVLQERASVAKSLEMLGLMKVAFDMTLAYAKEREQFGRPIGSFQAIQHHCADMAVDMDSSRLLTYQAAWKTAQGLPASKESAMAKAWTSNAACRLTRLAHQVHGAVAFCDEHDLHLYYRKAKAAAIAFGDGEYHFEKVAEHLGF